MIRALLLAIFLISIPIAGCAGQGGSAAKSPPASAPPDVAGSLQSHDPALQDCIDASDPQAQLKSCSKALESASVSRHDRAVLLVYRGSANLRLQRNDDAISDLDKALEVDPKQIWAHVFRGVAAMVAKDYDRAMSAFDTALEIDPNHPEARSDRGWLFIEMGEPKKAIADLDASIGLNPKRVDPYYWRAVANARLGNKAEAERDVAAVKAIDPGMIKRRGDPLALAEEQEGQLPVITVSEIAVIAVDCPAAEGWPSPRSDDDWEALIKASSHWTAQGEMPENFCRDVTLGIYALSLKLLYPDEAEAERRYNLMVRRALGD